MSDEIDDLVDQQLAKNQRHPSNDLSWCPNPGHTSQWHGLPRDGCPGSTADEFPEMPEVADRRYMGLSGGFWGPFR